jgi:hypothetical protein
LNGNLPLKNFSGSENTERISMYNYFPQTENVKRGKGNEKQDMNGK